VYNKSLITSYYKIRFINQAYVYEKCEEPTLKTRCYPYGHADGATMFEVLKFTFERQTLHTCDTSRLVIPWSMCTIFKPVSVQFSSGQWLISIYHLISYLPGSSVKSAERVRGMSSKPPSHHREECCLLLPRDDTQTSISVVRSKHPHLVHLFDDVSRRSIPNKNFVAGIRQQLPVSATRSLIKKASWQLSGGPEASVIEAYPVHYDHYVQCLGISIWQ